MFERFILTILINGLRWLGSKCHDLSIRLYLFREGRTP